MIIVFIGLPGSGKSTQMRLLSKVLESKGQKAKTLCLKRGFIASLIERILFLLICGGNLLYPYPLELLLRGAKDKLKRIIHLWYIINTFELYARLLSLLIMSRVCKLVMLIEEYIPAIIIDYVYVALRLGMPINKISKYINILIHSYLKVHPSRVIILAASMQELVRRWHKRGRAEYSYTYILVQQIIPSLVKTLTRHFDKRVLILDTTNKTILDTLKALIQSMSCLRTKY